MMNLNLTATIKLPEHQLRPVWGTSSNNSTDKPVW